VAETTALRESVPEGPNGPRRLPHRAADTAYPARMSDIVPDDKDWTWTLSRTCPECGITAGRIGAGDIADLVLAWTDPWPAVLTRTDVRDRPAAATWSPLEYACHVRDVCRLFEERLRSMLEEDGPTFANWDQDETAVRDRYGEQDPAVVAEQLADAAGALAARYAAVADGQWDRVGTRSNGSRFTVLTLGQYGLHDIGHHLVDVGDRPPERP